ncbi:MAG: flotillin domain-containing protein [Paracoccaceae bacterium]|nr:flotillin domain-containing protein [Paracoccaceae bacterium]MDG1369788.1 flotillin domain-containing protein [Paracoccaceae bacterium]
MIWFLTILAILVIAFLVILFLNRYYRKATREVALVRTGAGGQSVVLDGGCIALPFLHKVSEVNMKTSRLEIERLGPKSIITSDRLRVDVGAEFYVRVESSKSGVATAAQALAGKTFRSSDLADTLEGKLVDAMLAVAAGYTMDSLQDNRGKYSAEVTELLRENLAQNGLVLESVSITRLDQTPFHALDENNAFNALGMRRLSEIISVNKKERAEIEANAEVAVRQSQLEATKRKLTITQEEEEATIAQQREIETARAKSQADVAEEQATSEKRREAARIEREREVRLSEIAKDRELNQNRLESELSIETVKVENSVALAAKRIDEAKAEVEAKAAEALEAEAEEKVKTARETAAAERDKELALIRAKEQAEVDDTRVASEAGTVISMAKADAQALLEQAAAAKDEMLAKAEGTAAIVAAENTQTSEVIAMKLDQARIEVLPDVVEKMLKPTEKIESIRINHITGIGGGTGGDGGGRAAGGNGVNDVIDGVLGLALQLPAVKKLGEEVGLNISNGIKGVTAPLDGGPAKNEDEAEPTND